jgi:ribonuclease HII
MRLADSRPPPTFDLETVSLRLGSRLIAGVDEAGRGPWAGPVVAAAVILDPTAIPDGIRDSKQLDPDARARISDRIRATARVAVAVGDVARIDRDNILNATLWAMADAVRRLPVEPDLVLIDGNRAPRLPMPMKTVVRGDALSLSIAAASIIAKVTRDRLMVELAGALPGYGFERHKGYGTPEHRAALARLGASTAHRRSFRPVQLALGLETTGRGPLSAGP